MDASAALPPLVEASDAIRRLHEYETPTELASAIVTVRDAVERSLRLYLRSDSGAPESHRMRALSRDELPFEDVVQSLRSRDAISIEVAGAVHELRGAAERADSGAAGPADADIAVRAVQGLGRELRAASRSEASVTAPEPAPEAPDAPDEDVPDAASPVGRWMAWLASAAAVVFLLALGWVFTQSGGQDYDAAVQAFRAGRLDSAAAAFQRIVEDRPRDVSARLYLGRIYRRQLRRAEAAEVLRSAVAEAPEDPDVRRELGHLFMDLGQPSAAARQYERAMEIEPEEPRNWAGLIRALRALDDPRAEQLLREAPPDVQAALGSPRD